MAFHPPDMVASGDVSGVTRVWDLRNGEQRYRFTNPSSQEEGGSSTPAVNQALFVDPPGCLPGTLLLTASGECVGWRQTARVCMFCARSCAHMCVKVEHEFFDLIIIIIIITS